MDTIITFRYQDVVIPIEFRRRKVRAIRLRISREGEVSLTVPILLASSEADRFLREKSEWLYRKYKAKIARVSFTEMPFLSENTCFFLGRSRRVTLLDSAREGVRAEDGVTICVKGGDLKRAQKVYEKWLLAAATEVFSSYVTKWMPIFTARGIASPTLKIRKFRARWGSCATKTGEITFNLHLIKAYPDCVEYVVLHELTHLIHPDHGKEFHAFLTRYMPDWKVRKRRLNGGVGISD